jgi:hypothetical protein
MKDEGGKCGCVIVMIQSEQSHIHPSAFILALVSGKIGLVRNMFRPNELSGVPTAKAPILRRIINDEK